MSEPIFSAAHHSLFRTTTAALAESEPLDVVTDALNFLEASLPGFLHLAEVKPVCAAGCSFCCWLQVDVRAHEVFLIARRLRGLPEVERLEIATRVKESAQRSLAALKDGSGSSRPCPLLNVESQCSVYSVRPATCRRYFSLSLDACEAIWQRRPADDEVESPFVREAGIHLAAGVHNALIAAGYDGYHYDLTRALAEALTDPETEARWRRKECAFSIEARSAVPDGFSQDEALSALKAKLAAAGHTTGCAD